MQFFIYGYLSYYIIRYHAIYTWIIRLWLNKIRVFTTCISLFDKLPLVKITIYWYCDLETASSYRNLSNQRTGERISDKQGSFFWGWNFGLRDNETNWSLNDQSVKINPLCGIFWRQRKYINQKNSHVFHLIRSVPYRLQCIFSLHDLFPF